MCAFLATQSKSDQSSLLYKMYSSKNIKWQNCCSKLYEIAEHPTCRNAFHYLSILHSLQLRCLCSWHPLHPAGTYEHIADDHCHLQVEKKILNRVEERQVGGKEIGKVTWMDCKPVYLLHVNGGMHCTMQSQMTSCFFLHVPFQL